VLALLVAGLGLFAASPLTAPAAPRGGELGTIVVHTSPGPDDRPSQGRSVVLSSLPEAAGAGSGNTPDDAAAATPVAVRLTDGEGIARFDDVPYGAYLITERATALDSTALAPARITVPQESPENPGEWDTEVHVWPKEEPPSTLDQTPEVPNPLTTKWGNLVVRTHDAADQPIPGARYRLHLTRQDAIAGAHPLAVGGQSSWTSDGDGVFDVEGLRYSAYADGRAVSPGEPGYRSYWLAQTSSPDGFAPMTSPVEVLVTKHNHDIDYQIELAALRRTTPLPFVGGLNLERAVIGAGALLLVTALAAREALRRRRDHPAARRAALTEDGQR
jgi:hypothetical protein